MRYSKTLLSEIILYVLNDLDVEQSVAIILANVFLFIQLFMSHLCHLRLSRSF